MDRECEDHVYCIYEFPGPDYDKDPSKKIGVTYSSINGNGFGGYGEVVLGTKGTLILEREQEVMLFQGSKTATSVKVSEKKDGGGPVLDTTQSGGGEAAAVGKKRTRCRPHQPRLYRRDRALGLVHPQSRSGQHSALPSENCPRRCRDRIDDQYRHARESSHRF